MSGARLIDVVSGESYLENAFVKWVLSAAATGGIARHVSGQYPVTIEDRTYRLDYLLAGSRLRVVVELDGFAFHSSRTAFVHDRIRQNDLVGLKYVVLRFSYDAAIREHTARCVAQLQKVLQQDPVLATYVISDPIVPVPDDMDPYPLGLVTPPPSRPATDRSYFDRARERLDLSPLRECQRDALIALANYYRRGEVNAACVMSVGAGKTALGVAAALAFTAAAAPGARTDRDVAGTSRLGGRRYSRTPRRSQPSVSLFGRAGQSTDSRIAVQDTGGRLARRMPPVTSTSFAGLGTTRSGSSTVFVAYRSSSARVCDSDTCRPGPKPASETAKSILSVRCRFTTKTVTSPVSASWVATASRAGTEPYRSVW